MILYKIICGNKDNELLNMLHDVVGRDANIQIG